MSPVSDLAPSILAAGLHGLRLLPVALLCPFLGGPLVPGIVRLALAFGLGASAWAAGGCLPFTADGLAVLAGGARELGLGTALALVASMPFEAARAGGRLIDTLRGATLAELHVAALRQRESASGDLLAQALVVLAATAGGDRLVVHALLETFRAVPAGTAAHSVGLLAMTGASAGELLSLALALGAPAAAGVLAADLALALAARLAPQLQASSAAQPARAAAGLLALALPAAALAGRMVSGVALSARLLGSLSGGQP